MIVKRETHLPTVGKYLNEDLVEATVATWQNERECRVLRGV